MDRQQEETKRLPPMVSAANVCLLMCDYMAQILPVHIVGKIYPRSEQAQHKRRGHILALEDVVPEDNCLADFTAQTPIADYSIQENYASSGIDEIYILRQQKRAVVRRNPSQRKPINQELICELADILLESIEAMNAEVIGLENRMQDGKLIGRTL